MASLLWQHPPPLGRARSKGKAARGKVADEVMVAPGAMTVKGHPHPRMAQSDTERSEAAGEARTCRVMSWTWPGWPDRDRKQPPRRPARRLADGGQLWLRWRWAMQILLAVDGGPGGVVPCRPLPSDLP